MDDEFDTYAGWTAEAVEALGPDHAVPAGCRGSGSPASLAWLGRRMRLAEADRLLDVGAGIGGPAEVAATTWGVEPTLCDPMPGACAAARRLFERSATTASGHDLPFPDAAFDAAWALGVLCVVRDKVALLRETARVVKRGGSIGLLVFVRHGTDLSDQPTGNAFPTPTELSRAIARSGLAETHRSSLSAHAPQPERWRRMIGEVDDHIRQHHLRDRAWRRVDAQQQALTALLDQGRIEGVLVVCRRS